MVKYLSLSCIVIVLDQITKYYANQELHLHQAVQVMPGFNLTLMYNTGAAFSFLSEASGWQRWFFIGVATLISIAIIIWMHGLPANKRWLLTALALVLGGAIGNVCDRVLLGHVVDFIEVYYQNSYWPTFNIADSAITVGAVMLLIDAFFSNEKKIDN